MRKIEVDENRWIEYVYFNLGGIAYAIVATVNDYRDDKESNVEDGSFQGDWAAYCGATSLHEGNLSERETVDYAMKHGFKFPYEWAKGIFPDIAETGLSYRD